MPWVVRGHSRQSQEFPTHVSSSSAFSLPQQAGKKQGHLRHLRKTHGSFGISDRMGPVYAILTSRGCQKTSTCRLVIQGNSSAKTATYSEPQLLLRLSTQPPSPRQMPTWPDPSQQLVAFIYPFFSRCSLALVSLLQFFFLILRSPSSRQTTIH